MVALPSAVGLLLASSTIYLTYRPYWYTFQSTLQTGDSSQTPDLVYFIAATYNLGNLSLNLPIYFWSVITLLGVISLAIILLRHFLGHPRASPTS